MKRTIVKQIVLDPSEAKTIDENAKKQNITVSSYLRKLILPQINGLKIRWNLTKYILANLPDCEQTTENGEIYLKSRHFEITFDQVTFVVKTFHFDMEYTGDDYFFNHELISKAMYEQTKLKKNV